MIVRICCLLLLGLPAGLGGLWAQNQGITQPGGERHPLREEGYLEFGDFRLNYLVEGEGPACLVIGSRVYYPKTFTPELRRQLKMYFVDLPWFAPGPQPFPATSLSREGIVAMIEQIRQAFQLERPILLGHSIHGTIALEYAKRYPQNVSRVVAIGSPAAFGNAQYQAAAEALWATASPERKALQQANWGDITELDRLTGQAKASEEYHLTAPQYWYDMHYDARWLWKGMSVHDSLTQQLFTRVFAPYDMFADMPELPLPVLVIMGTYDYVIPYTLWQKAYPQITDFSLVLLEKSGHTPQLEQPARFDAILLEWLELTE